MASYEMETSPAPEAEQEQSKKISFRFCRECSNMLYPKEDRMNNTLMFACRTCPFSEPATASCIYRNELNVSVAETSGNVEDVAQDPTVGEPASDSAPHMCTLCGQEITCPMCGNPSEYGVFLEVEDEQEVDPVQQQERERAEENERRFSGVKQLQQKR